MSKGKFFSLPGERKRHSLYALPNLGMEAVSKLDHLLWKATPFLVETSLQEIRVIIAIFCQASPGI